jgi:cell wall-associated NlpC family hydrolase
MRYATLAGRRALFRAALSVLCVTLIPFLPSLAHADDDAPPPVPAAAPETSNLIASVSTTVHSAAGVVLRSAQDVTGQALDLIGVRYRFGGQTPERGLDCSGLVKYVFESVTGVRMPRSARDQAMVGERVDRDELQPGDLVFFNTRRAAFSHVGIYLGNNSFVHAPSTRSSVTVASIDAQYWRQRFNGARRLLGIMPGMVSIEAAKSLLQALPATVEQESDERPQ